MENMNDHEWWNRWSRKNFKKKVKLLDKSTNEKKGLKKLIDFVSR